MKKSLTLKLFAFTAVFAMLISATGCGNIPAAEQADTESGSSAEESDMSVSDSGENELISSEDIEIKEEIRNETDGEHAVEADGETTEYANVKVTKNGDSDSGDEADFYGDNAAVFATNGASLTLTDIIVDTDGTHANAVFSYGEGTTVNISNAVITTSGNCSGGLMTTGGGTMIAENLNVHTTGNSSAAIRSDRGGGTVQVTGGAYVTDGTGSPAIYSSADITVKDAYLESTAAQGVVVEGKNSVTLDNVQLVADNNTKNSDKSDYYQAVMIYQSMSGDAAEGEAAFTMTGGSLTNANGDIFFVNNTVTTITLENVQILNQDEDGLFLRAAAAGWGSSGSNGGKVNLYLKQQDLEGDISVDEVSSLNMYLTSGTLYSGAVNSENGGGVYVEIEEGSRWILTGDSHITSLTCSADGIDLNGYTLYIGGKAYTDGSASEGEAIVMVSTSAEEGGAPSGAPEEPPEGQGGPGSGSDQHEPPDGGKGGPGGNGDSPPPKPGENG